MPVRSSHAAGYRSAAKHGPLDKTMGEGVWTYENLQRHAHGADPSPSAEHPFVLWSDSQRCNRYLFKARMEQLKARYEHKKTNFLESMAALSFRDRAVRSLSPIETNQ